jgi:hypothetical protein
VGALAATALFLPGLLYYIYCIAAMLCCRFYPRTVLLLSLAPAFCRHAAASTSILSSCCCYNFDILITSPYFSVPSHIFAWRCTVFNGAAAFDQELGEWDVSSVTYMGKSMCLNIHEMLSYY